MGIEEFMDDDDEEFLDIIDRNASEVLIDGTPFHLPKMILIPEGPFYLGTSDKQIFKLWEDTDWGKGWREDGLFRSEQPQHKIILKAFEIGKFPVTNIEYFNFVWKSNYRVPKGWIGFRYAEGMDHHPVVNVALKDAYAYADWLSQITGFKYRLPSEAEWEKAATGPKPRIYPWGDVFDPWRCNTSESGKGGTTPVGTYSPAGDSPYGIADMSGNVFEWTSSVLAPYPFGEGKPMPGKEDHNTLRGGAWYYSAKLARCASREAQPVNYFSSSVGFRLVRDLD